MIVNAAEELTAIENLGQNMVLRWANKTRLWAILLVMMCSSASCHRPTTGRSSGSPDLLQVLRQLPDSMRENPFGAKQPFGLKPMEVEQLIGHGEVTTGDAMGWRLQFEDSCHHHLRLSEWGVDDGLGYEFLGLEGPRGAPWVLVLQSLGDHCCNYNRWGLYALRKGKLIDQTLVGMPSLDWNDFFAPSHLGDSPPASPRGNRFPFRMELQAHPAEIRIGVVADYLELNYPENVVAGMLENLPEETRILVWKDDRFGWAKE